MKKLCITLLCVFALVSCSQDETVVGTPAKTYALNGAVEIDSLDAQAYLVGDLIKIKGVGFDKIASSALSIKINGVECPNLTRSYNSIIAEIPKLSGGVYKLELIKDGSNKLYQKEIFVFGLNAKSTKAGFEISGVDFERSIKSINCPRGSFNNFVREDIDTLRNSNLFAYAVNFSGNKSELFTNSFKIINGELYLTNVNFSNVCSNVNDIQVTSSLQVNLKKAIKVNFDAQGGAYAEIGISSINDLANFKLGYIEMESNKLGTKLLSKDTKQILKVNSGAKIKILISENSSAFKF